MLTHELNILIVVAAAVAQAICMHLVHHLLLFLLLQRLVMVVHGDVGLLLLDEHLLLSLLRLLRRDGDLGVLLLLAAVEGQRTLDEEVAQALRVLRVQEIQFLLLGQEKAVLQSLQNLIVLSIQKLVVDGVDLIRKVRREEMQVLAPVVGEGRALVDVGVAILVEVLVGLLLVSWKRRGSPSVDHHR